MRGLQDLSPSVMYHVLVHLGDERGLASVACTCRNLRAATDEGIWEHLAFQRFPHASLKTLEPYSSFKELVRDRNRQHCVEGVSLAARNQSAHWKRNNAGHLYYECKLLHMELSTLPDDMSLRVFYDARGEEDLRGAETSALAVVSGPIGGNDSRSAVHAFLHPTRIKQPVMASTSGGAHMKGILSWDGDAVQRLLTSLAPPTAPVLPKLDSGLGAGSMAGAAAPPAGAEPLDVPMGHDVIPDTAAPQGPAAAAQEPAAAAQGPAARRLVFSFSNIGPTANRTDYETVCLLEVALGMTFDESWKKESCYFKRGEAEQALMMSEGEEEERARWIPTLPAELVDNAERFRRWWVPYQPPKACEFERVQVQFQAWFMEHFPLAVLGPFEEDELWQEDENEGDFL